MGFYETMLLDPVQLVVCQSKIYFPPKKKTLNKIKLDRGTVHLS